MDAYSQVALPGGGTKLQTKQNTVGANIVDAQCVVIVDANGLIRTLIFVSVAQGAAGTTAIAAASALNKHKIVGVCLTMSAAGTLKFTDGVADLTGPMDFAATGGFVLATSLWPYTQTGAINRALNLVTTGGKANGVVVILTEP